VGRPKKEKDPLETPDKKGLSDKPAKSSTSKSQKKEKKADEEKNKDNLDETEKDKTKASKIIQEENKGDAVVSSEGLQVDANVPSSEINNAVVPAENEKAEASE
jgi:hypothetical protein